ncbi:MAG: class I SAM-dependent methyltransferase [Acidovorax sp.]
MSYFDNINPTVLGEVPSDARKIGEVGCGAGAMARAIKARQPVQHYCGIDIQQDQLLLAQGHLEQAIQVDLNRIGEWHEAVALAPLLSGDFDCWIAGDVLEHLIAPEATLRAIHRSLKPGGTALVCVPNVCNWQVFTQLVRGSWPREDAGLFDRTHLRWFSATDMKTLLESTGFQVEKMLARTFHDDLGHEVLEFFEPLCDYLGVDFDSFQRDGMALQHVYVARKAM